jgi:hypothetical protein
MLLVSSCLLGLLFKAEDGGSKFLPDTDKLLSGSMPSHATIYTLHRAFYEDLRCSDTSVPKVLTFLLVSLLNKSISYYLPYTTCIF